MLNSESNFLQLFIATIIFYTVSESDWHMPCSLTWPYAPQENLVLLTIHGIPLKGQDSYKSLEIQSEKNPAMRLFTSLVGKR